MKIKFLAIVMLVFFVGAVSAQNKYVGVKKCGMCHKKDKTGNQLKVWKGSLHSKAFVTLKSKEADEVSMKKDGKKAAENPNCLKCHAPQYNVDAKLLGKKFKLEDGVQCESCHGAGSAYAKNKIMKDQAKSIEKGLHLYKDPANELCVKCHNEESPTFKGFDFEKYWAKIKHTIPNK